jgi:hypothetical protein
LNIYMIIAWIVPFLIVLNMTDKLANLNLCSKKTLASFKMKTYNNKCIDQLILRLTPKKLTKIWNSS